MSTIQVSARGVTTVREAFDEVDALVEALKNRADEVLRMVGRELDHPDRGDRDRDTDDDHSGAVATAAKSAATLLATKAVTSAATSAAGSAARHAKATAEDVTRGATKRAKKASGRKTSRKAAKKAKKTAKRLKGKALDTASELVDTAKGVADLAPESLHLPAKRRRSTSRGPIVVVVTLGAAAVVAVLVWRQRQRTKELRAVDNTAPDEFGAMVERAELAGTPPAT